MAFKDKDRTPVAQILVTQCTRCKLPLTHMVVTHTAEGIVDRVQCRTCGSTHKYRPERKAVKKAAKKRGVPAKKGKPSAPKVFEKLSLKFQDKDPVSYTMNGSYRENDVIHHKTFGKGIVTAVYHQKMDVVFADASRTLVCDR